MFVWKVNGRTPGMFEANRGRSDDFDSFLLGCDAVGFIAVRTSDISCNCVELEAGN
jgi:hypothetical protein